MLIIDSVSQHKIMPCCALHGKKMKYANPSEEIVYKIKGRSSGHFSNLVSFAGKNYRIFKHIHDGGMIMDVDVVTKDGTKHIINEVKTIKRVKDRTGSWIAGMIILVRKDEKIGKFVDTIMKDVVSWHGNHIDQTPEGQWPVTLLAVEVH